MSAILQLNTLNDIVKDHGYWGVGLVVGLESMGLPLQGETVLVIAAIYCGAGGDLAIMGHQAVGGMSSFDA